MYVYPKNGNILCTLVKYYDVHYWNFVVLETVLKLL